MWTFQIRRAYRQLSLYNWVSPNKEWGTRQPRNLNWPVRDSLSVKLFASPSHVRTDGAQLPFNHYRPQKTEYTEGANLRVWPAYAQIILIYSGSANVRSADLWPNKLSLVSELLIEFSRHVLGVLRKRRLSNIDSPCKTFLQWSCISWCCSVRPIFDR